MFNPPLAHPNAAHDIYAPGGYEWWHFAAIDPLQQLTILATFYRGYILDRQYLRQYRRYLRQPTRRKPPAPADFPCLALRVLSTDSQRPLNITERATGPLHLTSSPLHFALNANVFSQHDDGAYHLHLHSQGREGFTADLTFTPSFPHPPLTNILTPGAGEHRWIAAAPNCAVRGSISIPSSNISFSGFGYHDHHVGTRPIALGNGSFTLARAITPSRALAFCRLTGPQNSPSTLVESDALSLRSAPALSHRDWITRVHRTSDIRIEQLTLLSRNRYSAHFEYDATLEGQPARALCDVIAPAPAGGQLLADILAPSA
jgi:hypothetical protein